MPEFVCSACQAEIERDLIEKTGRAACPFCEADLSALGLPHPTSVGDEPTEDSEAAARDAMSPNGDVTRPLPAVPDKSRIKVVESTPERLVLFIPAGGKQSGGLGIFALLWNGFLCVFSPLMIGGILKNQGGNAPSLLFVVPFLGLFWAVGLGFAWFWLKFKYERTFLLLDRDRIAVQKLLFNRKRLEETPLGPESRADLVESYQQNEKPVYRIEVSGTSGAAKFGTALSDEEKDWLVDRINEFLGVGDNPNATETDADRDESVSGSSPPTYPNECDQCGAPLAGKPIDGVVICEHCGAIHRGTASPPSASTQSSAPRERFERLTAESLPEGGAIRVLESSPDRLAFQTSLAADSPLRRGIPLFAFPFAVAWYSFIGFFAWNTLREPFGFFAVLHLLFLIPFFVAGFLPLGLGLYAIAGDTTVRVTRARISVRWGIGPIGYTRHIPTESVSSVGIEQLSNQGNPRVRGNRIRGRNAGSAPGNSGACILRGGGKMLPLTLVEDLACARQVASLVRTKLEEWGQTLTDG